MIIGVGVDVCHVERFQQMLERRPGIASRLLTEGERERSITSQAGRFAAKEALAKALGSPGGLSWQDAEVVQEASGRPSFELRGAVRTLMESLGGTHTHLSISHDAGIATAFVVVEMR